MRGVDCSFGTPASVSWAFTGQSHRPGPAPAGEGVGFNPAVAFELVRTAAERGDAEAQAYLGFRLAMGIYPPLPGESHTAVVPVNSG